MGFKCAVEKIESAILDPKVAPARFLASLRRVVKEDLRGDSEDVWRPPRKHSRDRVGFDRHVAVVEVNATMPSDRAAARNGARKAQRFFTVLPAHAWILSGEMDIVLHPRP